MNNLERALHFFSACERKDWASLRSAMADDLLYHNIPTPPVIGADIAMAGIKKFLAPCAHIEWIIRTIAESESGVVLSERLDRFVYPGGHTIAIPVMGSMVFRNEKLAEWRDYFDLADFKRQMPP